MVLSVDVEAHDVWVVVLVADLSANTAPSNIIASSFLSLFSLAASRLCPSPTTTPRLSSPYLRRFPRKSLSTLFIPSTHTAPLPTQPPSRRPRSRLPPRPFPITRSSLEAVMSPSTLRSRAPS